MNSKDMLQKLEAHFLAGSPAIYIHSAEESRVDQLLARFKEKLRLRHIHEWNLGHGWVDFDNKQPLGDPAGGKTELEHALLGLLDADLEQSLVLLKGARLALEHNNLATARLKQLLNRIERHHAGECAVMLVSEAVSIPAAIEAQVTLLSLPLPAPEEIGSLLDQAEASDELHIPDELRERTISALRGLTDSEIGQLLKMISRSDPVLNEQDLESIRREKEQIIAKSGVLEMVDTTGLAPSDIGGLENLKKWLGQRATIIHHLQDAAGRGVKPPKGVLIAGMPGCGKSLTAKVAASLFQQPLLRLDIGSLLGKYVGESEHNMRRALSMAETVSPCVLWIDELEKAFVGMGGGNASEVTARLLGYFLTWMQEKTGAVFVIATANDISALPPELLRKGRFDEIFYVGFPNAVERRAILDIHLQRVPEAARQPLDDQQASQLVELCRDYSGADIENAVNEACANAFIEDCKLDHEQLAASIQSTIPLRETLREQVGRYEELFERLKLRPASEYQGLSVAQMIKMADDPNQVKREEVASNQDCPEDLLEKLAKDPQPGVVKAVYRNPRCPERLLSIRLSIPKGNPQYDAELLELACLHGNAPEDLLVHQINEGNIDQTLRLKLASRLPENRPAPGSGLPTVSPLHQKLAKDSDIEVRRALARNTDLSVEIQELFAKDQDACIRRGLAARAKIPESLQALLVTDSDTDVRQNLAKNPDISGATIGTLAKDAQFAVRFHLASHPGLDGATLALLAADAHSNVRKVVAGRPALPEELQLKLASDSSEEVVAALMDNAHCEPAVRFAIFETGPLTLKRKLSALPALTAEEQTQLLRESDVLIRGALAVRKDLDESIQCALAGATEHDVRINLARNPVLGNAAQELLYIDRNESVRLALAENPSLSLDEQKKQALKRLSIQSRHIGVVGARMAGFPWTR